MLDRFVDAGGPRTVEQLEGLLGATSLTLAADERARLEPTPRLPTSTPSACCASRRASAIAVLRRPSHDP
jgi:hypothetical protein